MKLLIEAAILIFGSGAKAEQWLDDNSSELNTSVSTLDEAKNEIWRVKQKIRTQLEQSKTL